MNQLLKGLLAADPEERLSAHQALCLPVFDKYRGTQLPELSSPQKSKNFHFIDEDTDVFDEGCPVSSSIRSLEGRSIVLKKPMDSLSHTTSNYSPSVRWEGESQAGDNSPDPSKRPFRRRLPSNLKGEPSSKAIGPHLLPRQESFDTESKFSADDRISPMGSPQPQKRGIQFPESGQNKFLTPQMQPRQISLFGANKTLASYGQPSNQK